MSNQPKQPESAEPAEPTEPIAPTASELAQELSAHLATGDLANTRDGIRAFATAHPLVTLTHDGDTAILGASDGDVLVAFDTDGQIERLAFAMQAAPDADSRPRLLRRLFGRR